jgi:hypothetical protein
MHLNMGRLWYNMAIHRLRLFEVRACLALRSAS